jgi:hypothetical protein
VIRRREHSRIFFMQKPESRTNGGEKAIGEIRKSKFEIRRRGKCG